MHQKILIKGQQVGCVIVIFGELVVCWPVGHAFTGICKHKDIVVTMMISTLVMFWQAFEQPGLICHLLQGSDRQV